MRAPRSSRRCRNRCAASPAACRYLRASSFEVRGRTMNGQEIERLIQLLGRLPGLGPRSARRAALHLLKKRETLMQPLSAALAEAAGAIKPCTTCGNLDTVDPCSICADPRRDAGLICVVEDVGDLW